MLKMNYDLQEALTNYLELLQKERYFDAHEVLEEAWHPLRLSKDRLKDPIRGLINAAIAFEHIKRDTESGYTKAKKVIRAYDRHREECKESILLRDICKDVDILKREKEL